MKKIHKLSLITISLIQAFSLCAAKKDMKQDIGDIDSNMAIKKSKKTGIVWHSPTEQPFKIAGFAWFNQDKVYRRLPLKSSYPLPRNVNILANHTSGGQIKFRSNSSKIIINVKLNKNVGNMCHMPATGQFGFDLYIGKPGKQKYYSTAAFKVRSKKYQSTLFSSKDKIMREFTLNFPLYSGVKEILIGLDADTKIEAPSQYSIDKPIVIYGGSTIQGACASRPGACHMNIISRKLNMQVINLGFSGSGKLEQELARIMAEIINPAIYIIECERNSKYKLLSERQEKFIKILRQKHAEVPIMIITANPRGSESLKIGKRRIKNWNFMHDLVEKMRKEGDNNIYFVDGSKMLGEDFYECFVDGSHPSDLGFFRMAQGWVPVLKKILKIQ